MEFTNVSGKSWKPKRSATAGSGGPTQLACRTRPCSRAFSAASSACWRRSAASCSLSACSAAAAAGLAPRLPAQGAVADGLARPEQQGASGLVAASVTATVPSSRASSSSRTRSTAGCWPAAVGAAAVAAPSQATSSTAVRLAAMVPSARHCSSRLTRSAATPRAMRTSPFAAGSRRRCTATGGGGSC